MSLFDVIKYPISNSPTEVELRALPTAVLNLWLSSTGWQDNNDDKNYFILHIIANWYELHYKNPMYANTCVREIAMLRQMIKDYDEPI